MFSIFTIILGWSFTYLVKRIKTSENNAWNQESSFRNDSNPMWKRDKLKKVSKHANQKMNGHDNLFTVVCRHKIVDKGQ